MSFHRAKSALVGTRFGDVRSVAETGSTNADMRTMLASAGLAGLHSPPPIVLLADHQTAGRGRLDRTWEAPPGSSVLMSIGLPVGSIAPTRRPLATTCLALAVTDATASLGLSEVRIKWPNDVVVDVSDDAVGPGYRKVGGILAELHPVEGVGDCLVLGIGLNVNWPSIPDELAAVATSLDRLAGGAVDRDDLVIATLTALDRTWLPLLESPGGDAGAPGLDDMWQAYAARSATLGRRVRIELPASLLEGVATAVTTDGALEVLGDDGVTHRITVGDVVHLRPA